MKKITLMIFTLMLCLICSAGIAFADELSPPQKPNTDNLSAEEANQLINDYNNQVDIYNQQLDNNYQQAVQNVDNHNAQVEEQYVADQQQYDIDYAQYEKDKAFEEKIIADPRYNNIDQYNEAVTKYNNQIEKYNASVQTYNEQVGVTEEIVNSAVENNTNAPEVPISDTYILQKSATPSERNIPVSIQHYFLGTNVSYSTNITMNSNDILTFTGIGPKGNPPVENYCYFFYNTDANHTLGIWSNTYSYLESDAEVDTAWNYGDIHTVYFDSNKSYVWQFAQIKMIYYYMWIPLYQTRDLAEYANVPVLPTVPVKGELWTYPAKPTHIPHLNLIPIQSIDNVINNNYAYADELPVDNNTTYSGTTAYRSANFNSETIADDDTPLYGGNKTIADHWALINLICMLINILLLVFIPRKKQQPSRRKNNVVLVICALAAVILFIFTENIWLPMILVDQWTIWMIIIAAIGCVYTFKKRKQEQNTAFE